MNRLMIIVLLFVIIYKGLFSQPLPILETESRKQFRIMSYNVENLFDTIDDPVKQDEEFLPSGPKFWNEKKITKKLFDIYKVIMAVGEGGLPAIVGFCEIENRNVLNQLIYRTPLYSLGYRIIHYESPDTRGVDVAILYNKNVFDTIFTAPIRIQYPPTLSTRTTRDILYVKGVFSKTDTVHIYMNHWPSKFGGAKETEPLRMFVGELLRAHTDSVMKSEHCAKIVIMGDLNDEPNEPSLTRGLKAINEWDKVEHNQLYNLSYRLEHEEKKWTHKFGALTGIIDIFIVSGCLLDTTSPLFCLPTDTDVFYSDFLLEDDEKFTGKKPFRTYIGFTYHGGYSDHLPIFLDLRKRSK
ncbi:MAG: endonuclease [Bacteroidales bacterium]